MSNQLPRAASGCGCTTDAAPLGLAGEVYTLIGQVEKKLQAIRRWTHRDTGLTPPQLAILRALGQRDAQPLKDLAHESQCTRATMTRLVDGLERRALVTRQTNPADRRSLLVTLTKAGRTVLTGAPGLTETYGTCCTGLTEPEYQRLARLLERLRDALDCDPPSGAAPPPPAASEGRKA